MSRYARETPDHPEYWENEPTSSAPRPTGAEAANKPLPPSLPYPAPNPVAGLNHTSRGPGSGRSPIVYGSSRPRVHERVLDLLRAIDLYVRSDGREGGEHLMPYAATAIGALLLFIVFSQAWLWFERAH